MTWIMQNPELFILAVVVLLLALIVFRSLRATTSAVDEPESLIKQDRSLERPLSEAESGVALISNQTKEDSESTPSLEFRNVSEGSAEENSDGPVEENLWADPISSDISEQKKNVFISALERSREALMGGLSSLWSGKPLDEEALEELEDTLISADLGAHVAMEIIEELREKSESGSDGEALRNHLRTLLLDRIGETQPIAQVENGPLVILVVGVNGSGKTTTIGKLAHRYIQDGKSVMVAAGDTFRAGAIEQLKVWSERSGAEFISSQPKADPASVIYTALEAAKARDVDIVICDTAGRLQAQTSLMDELKKVARVGKKVIADAPHEVLLVLDATIGQNALSQAEGFNEAANLTGVVLTKLDGTAKGGVVVAVNNKLGIPVKLVGLGEGIDDLRLFSPVDFVDALLLNENAEE